MRSDAHGWLSSNELRNYPFKENAELIPTLFGTPHVPLPPGVLIDLMITTPYTLFKDIAPGFEVAHIPPLFKLRSILKESTTVTLTFSETYTGDLPELDIAEVTISLGSFEERAPYKLTGLIGATHGVAVFGSGFLPYMTSLGLGEYLLDDDNGALQERSVRDNPFSRVTSVSELGDVSTLLVGDVKLEEGHNVELTILPERNGIRIDAFPGAGAGAFCGQGCAAVIEDFMLVPASSDGWLSKQYPDTPAVTGEQQRRRDRYATDPQYDDGSGSGFCKGFAPDEYFEEDFDDSDFVPRTLRIDTQTGTFPKNGEVVLRREFFFDADDIFRRALIVRCESNDVAEVYWNGVPVSTKIADGATALGFYVFGGSPLPPPYPFPRIGTSGLATVINVGFVPNSLLKTGRNVLAILAADAVLSSSTPSLGGVLDVSVESVDSAGCSNAIYTINGIPPTNDGDFFFSGARGVTVDDATNGIVVGSTFDAGNICERSGDAGAAGPDGPAGPGGAPGATPPAQCCSCNTCEKCNICETCNTCEGFQLCGECDLTIREPGCQSLADGGIEITVAPPGTLGAKFQLILPYDEDPC